MESRQFFFRYSAKTSLGYIFFSSIVAIVIGLTMLLYPGGTLALMKTGFHFFQVLLTIFILYYALSEAIHAFRSGTTVSGVTYSLIGILFTIFVWYFKVEYLFYVVAFFILVNGITELIGAFSLPFGRFFLFFLGILDIAVAVIIYENPLFLAVLIAWYILFWGISRLLLGLELRSTLPKGGMA